MNSKYLGALVLFGMFFNIAFDQYTKYLAEENLMVWSHPENLREYQGQRTLLYEIGERSVEPEKPSFYMSFSFNYVRNLGAAWGVLSDWDDQLREPFFFFVVILAIFGFIYYYWITPKEHVLVRVSLQLLIAGALGNLIDRIHRGYVVDFIDVRWVFPFPAPVHLDINFFPTWLNILNIKLDASAWSYAFPNFNWADTVISIAFILMMIEIIWLEPRRNQALLGSPLEN